MERRASPLAAAAGWARARWARLLTREGRWPRLLVVAASLLVLGMYCTNTDMGGDPDSPRGDGQYRPVLARGDGHLLYLIARSTALDGDWVFDNDLARFGDPWQVPRTKTGRKSIVHPVGPALVWTPLIWIAQGGAVAANALGARIALHGYTLWHQRFVFLSSALFGIGAALLGRRVARRLVGGAWAPSYAAVCALLGTPLAYYATHMPSYSHAMDAFACAAFLAYWALTLGRRDVRRWLALGALLGLAMLVRVQELGMGVVVALECAAEATRAARARDGRGALRWLGGGALALGAALVVFSPQLLEWRIVFGSATGLPQGSRFTRLEAPMIGEVLFSARNGWFSTTPIAYLGVIGLLVVPARARFVAAGLLAAVAVQVYLNSTVFDWWGGAALGQRRLCSMTLPLVVGFAALIWRAGRLAARARRLPRAAWHVAWVLLVAGPLVAWNLARVFDLRHGKPAPSELSPSCCAAVPGPLRAPARWLYDRIGAPFQLPASAVFALAHGVELARWDLTVGRYPLVPPWTQLDDAQLPRHRGAWRIGDAGMEPFLVGGFSAPARAERPFRWTTAAAATVLVPNLMPYGQRLELWLAAGGATHVTLRFEGAVVASAELTERWTKVGFDLPSIPLHTNELTIESAPAPLPPRAGWPAPPGPVGVAVGELELSFLPRR